MEKQSYFTLDLRTQGDQALPLLLQLTILMPGDARKKCSEKAGISSDAAI
jgi:hypothetical protein